MGISLKPVIIFSTIALVILAGIEIFTPVNILRPPFLQNPAHAEFPLLKDNVQSDTHELHFLHDTYATHITYSPIGNFFLVVDRNYLKIDASGTTVFSHPTAYETVKPPRSFYIIDANEIYDLSASEVRAETVVEILNDSSTRRFKEDYWQNIFTTLYDSASVVLFGSEYTENNKFPTYFKVDQGWVLLYSSYDHISLEYDRKVGATLNGLPAKYERMVLLKDPDADVFANGDADYYNRFMPELDFEYPARYGVQMLSYQKEFISANNVYTPIPAKISGPASYEIKVADGVLNFRETAAQMVGSGPASNMTRFILPTQYFGNADISFLEFRPLNNIDTSGSDGLYVIRPRP